IEFHHAHVVEGADGIAGQLRRRIRKRRVKKISRQLGDVEKMVAAGHAMVDTGGREEMPHVVHLEVLTVVKRPSILISVPPADENWRMKIAVLALCPSYRLDRHFNKPFELGSLRLRQRRA